MYSKKEICQKKITFVWLAFCSLFVRDGVFIWDFEEGMKWKVWLLILLVLWGLGFLIRESVFTPSQNTILQNVRDFAIIDQGDLEIKLGLNYVFDWKVITGDVILSWEKDETKLKSDFSFAFEQKGKEIAENILFSWEGKLFSEDGELREVLESWAWYWGVGNIQNDRWEELIARLRGRFLGLNLNESRLFSDLRLGRDSFKDSKMESFYFGGMKFNFEEVNWRLIVRSEERTGDVFWGELVGVREWDSFMLRWHIGKRQCELKVVGSKDSFEVWFRLADADPNEELLEGKLFARFVRSKKSLQSFAKSYTPFREYLAGLD